MLKIGCDAATLFTIHRNVQILQIVALKPALKTASAYQVKLTSRAKIRSHLLQPRVILQ